MNGPSVSAHPSMNDGQYPPNPDDYVFEVPAQPAYQHQPKIPSGFTPMEHIQLEGMMFKAISKGNCPWIIIFALWFLLGVGIFLVLIPLVGELLIFATRELGQILNGSFNGESFSYLLTLGQSLIFPGVIFAGVLVITWRGFIAKFRQKR